MASPQLVTVSADGLTVDVDNSPIEFEMAYSMRFGDGPVGMPDQLTLGSAGNILGVDAEIDKESFIGTALFPAVNATANSDTDAATSTVVPLLRHPGIAQIRVEYHLPYQCPMEEDFNGTSTFTLFASGRIVRQDIVQPSQRVLRSDGPAHPCGRQNPQASNFFFTSFWTFNKTTDPKAVRANGMLANTADLAAACTVSPDYSVAVQWKPNEEIDAVQTRFGPNQMASHVFDFISGETMVTQEYVDSARDLVSVVQLDPTMNRPNEFCGTLLELVQDRTLLFDGVGLTPDPQNGIYTDALPHLDRFIIEASETILAGWAISVNLGGSQHAEFKPDTEFTTPPMVQELPADLLNEGERPGDRFLIYFADPLPAGQSIEIVPL